MPPPADPAPAPCPVDDWWPDALEDWGDVQDPPGSYGAFDQFWTDGFTYCFYDDDGDLLGRYIETSADQADMTFHFGNEDGDASGGFSLPSFGFEMDTNDSRSSGISVNLKRITPG